MKLIQQSIFKFFVGACLAILGLGIASAGVGAGGTGRTAYGGITAFGSIFVNGIEYSTSTANIIINGMSNRPESELKLGMAVRVEGSINSDGRTGTATVVEFIGDIEGSIDAVPVITGTRGTFAIYGLVIKTDSKTKYDNVSGLAALVAGDAVEVSGLFNANDGSFSATRIEKQTIFRKAELRGKISNVTATTFKLGPSLIVNYSAAELRDIPAGGLTNGLFVEVKTTTEPVSNTLAAERVSVESSVLASANIPFGLVQGIAANVSNSGASQAAVTLAAKAAGDGSFVMGNQSIVTNAQTVFTGAPLSALANGVTALATGPVVNGVMTAEEVSFVLGPAVSADLSADLKSDVLFNNTSTGEIAAWLMNGPSVTSAALLLGPGAWTTTHTADLNGDGKADLLLRNNSDGTVVLWLMNGLGVTSGTTLLSAGSGWSVSHTGDFNGDGKADILLRHTDGRIVLWLMNGSTVSSGTSLLPAGTGYSAVHVADFNGDGKADILLRNTSDGTLVLWTMNGGAVTTGTTLLSPNSGYTPTHTGDFNGDGKADILLRNNANGSIVAWLMNGATVTSGTTLIGASNWYVNQVADFNGDGKSDILLRNADGTIVAWLMNGSTVSSGSTLFGPTTAWAPTKTGDYNGDGKADIIMRNNDGTLVMWLMNGGAISSGNTILGPGFWNVGP
jgi:hypothetical protein